jgi:hypothetical protein
MDLRAMVRDAWLVLHYGKYRHWISLPFYPDTLVNLLKIGKKEYLIGCSYALCSLSFLALRIL